MTDSESMTERPKTSTAGLERRPGFKIPLAIVAAQLAGLLFAMQSSTLIPTAIGSIVGAALALILLLAWWLAFSRVSMKERLAGIGLFAALATAMVLLQPAHLGIDVKSSILIAAIPSFTFGFAALLLLTHRMPWKSARMIIALYLLGVGIYFGMQRVEGTRGDLWPELAWRFTPTADERIAAVMKNQNVDTHGTAELPATTGAQDWVGFRGPKRDGRAEGIVFAKNWAEQPPEELWRRPVGLGWSSFAAVGDYVFTQEQRLDEEMVVCYHATSGDEIWVNTSPERFEDSMGSGPRATPTYFEGKLYVQGATGMLLCIDAATGKTIWETNIAEDTGVDKLPQWGFASSPLVTEGIVAIWTGAKGGKSVAAYAMEDGKMLWNSGDGTHGYSSVHLANFSGTPQLVIPSDIGVQSLDLRTGTVLWENRWETKMNPRCVQPMILDGDRVLIGTASGMGTRSLKILESEGEWEVQEEWTERSFRPYFNDFVYHEGYCYGFDGAKLACLDAKTGELMWRDAKYGGQILLVPDIDAVVLLTEAGDVLLIEPSPDACNVVAEFKAVEGKTWNHPVVANGKLFVRNSDEAVAYALRNSAA